MAAKLTDDELMAALRVVPQRLVGRMLGGRQTVHLQRMADQWGFPVDVKLVDLFAVLSRLWEFLKRHGPVLKVLMEDDGSDGDEGALGVQYLKAKIRKTKADADAAEIRNATKEGRLCDVAAVHEIFTLVVSAFQAASLAAQKKWGADGLAFFDELSSKMGVAFEGFIATYSAGDSESGEADPQADDDGSTSQASDVV